MNADERAGAGPGEWLARVERWAEADALLPPPRVVADERVEIGGGGAACVACSQVELEVPYLDIAGQPQIGAARLWVREGARAPLPLVAVMHYEMSPEGAAAYLAEGWTVLTTRQGLVAAGDSLNFGSALAHLARLLPFVDPAKIALVGGSAGGYASLMVAADAFPLAGIVPFVPPLNLAYTMAYLHHAAEVSGCPASLPTTPEEWAELLPKLPVPVVCQVQSIVRDLEALLGPYGENAENWHRASPLAVWSLLTCPILLAYSTADVLVPIQQMDAQYVQRAAADEFPPGYSFDFEVVLPRRARPDTLAEVIDRDRAATFVVPVPETVPAVWEEPAGGAEPFSIESPFSGDKPVSLVILDEGPPHPRATHTKRRLDVSHLAFLRHCFSRPIAPEALTRAKLARLMQRFVGQEPDGLLDCRASQPQPLRRRSSPVREKADVLVGLRTYVESGVGQANAQRLAVLYAALPEPLRALDEPGRPFEADVRGNVRRAIEQCGLTAR